MTNCKPGDLALVVKGLSTGRSAKVVGPATRGQVEAEFRKKAGLPPREGDVPEDIGQIWEVDSLMIWRSFFSGKELRAELYFQPDTHMIPINPKDEQGQKTKDKELVV